MITLKQHVLGLSFLNLFVAMEAHKTAPLRKTRIHQPDKLLMVGRPRAHNSTSYVKASPSWLATVVEGSYTLAEIRRNSMQPSVTFNGYHFLLIVFTVGLIVYALIQYSRSTLRHVDKQREHLWDKFATEEDNGIEPEVFKYLSLDKDGGFTEVKNLYSNFRLFTMGLLLLFVVYNITYLTYQDIQFVTNPEGAVAMLSTFPSQAKLAEATDNVLNSFYFSKEIMDWAWTATGHEADFSAVQVLGLLELFGVLYYMFGIVLDMHNAVFFSGVRRWFGVQDFCWRIMPTLSSYSAMKALQYCHPTIVTRELTTLLNDIEETYQEKDEIDPKTNQKHGMMPILDKMLELILWPITALACCIVGFDTFLMKLRVVSGMANNESPSIGVVLPCIQFIVQVLGVVELGPFVRNRLYLFIFGGEDAVLQRKERRLMETWDALLARRMYKDIWLTDGHSGTGYFYKFVAVLLSFSDEDFQSLLLNESKTEKDDEIGDD